MFRVEDIKAGYLLEMEDGDLCTVQYGKEDKLGISSEKNWWYVDCFDENLTFKDSEIMKIYGRTDNFGLCRRETTGRKLLWKRKPTLTIEEAEKKFNITIIN